MAEPDPGSQQSNDPYKILGITNEYTTAEIKRSYKDLALKYHPDKNDGKFLDFFKKINLAYHTLIDAEKRELYDTTGKWEGLDSGDEFSCMQNWGFDPFAPPPDVFQDKDFQREEQKQQAPKPNVTFENFVNDFLIMPPHTHALEPSDEDYNTYQVYISVWEALLGIRLNIQLPFSDGKTREITLVLNEFAREKTLFISESQKMKIYVCIEYPKKPLSLRGRQLLTTIMNNE